MSSDVAEASPYGKGRISQVDSQVTDSSRSSSQRPRHRSRSRSPGRRARSRSRDRSRRRSSERSRDRSPGRSRDRSRERSRERSHGRSRDRSQERSRGRSREGNRDRDYDRERDYDRYRRRSRSRDRYDDRRRGYDSRRRDDKPRDHGRRRDRVQVVRTAAEKELFELSRDARTVFISQLVVRATEDHVWDYFERVGAVEKVSLIKDKVSGKSKGMGYVEFSDLDSVPKALLLHGQKFCMRHPACTCSGFPVSVKPSEFEKNYAAEAEAAGGSAFSVGAEKRIYLCDLPSSITEADLRLLGEQIGEVEKVMIIRDDRGRSKNCGFIAFSSPEVASTALSSLHNIPFGDRKLKVGRLTALGQVAAVTGETFSLDVDGSNTLTKQARAALSAQLSSGVLGAAQKLAAGLMQQLNPGANGDTKIRAFTNSPEAEDKFANDPARVLRINNLRAPEGPLDDWKTDICNLFIDEISRISGILPKYSHADVQGGIAHVYLLFDDAKGVGQALAAIIGRSIGGSEVEFEPVTLSNFISVCHDASSLL